MRVAPAPPSHLGVKKSITEEEKGIQNENRLLTIFSLQWNFQQLQSSLFLFYSRWIILGSVGVTTLTVWRYTLIWCLLWLWLCFSASFPSFSMYLWKCKVTLATGNLVCNINGEVEILNWKCCLPFKEWIMILFKNTIFQNFVVPKLISLK